MVIRVIVNGAFGRMGQETVNMLKQFPNEFLLVGECGHQDNLDKQIKKLQPQIVIDFTTAEAAYHNAKIIINNHVHPVIGTSGFLPNQIQELQAQCHIQQLGGIIAPNFSIGAILMMKCAVECSHYFDHVEIIELHHDQKADAPSGTAIKTADMIAKVKKVTSPKVQENEIISGARGAKQHDIHIHSVRLPGLTAHQKILFGNAGELLTIQHDSFNRASFMPGIRLACHKVLELKELIYGLENII